MTSKVPLSIDRPGIMDPTQLRLDPEAQTFWQRGLEKCKQQPFVPLGALLTCFALGGAFRELRRGNSKQLNRYLRFRVVAQGATVVAMVAGSYIYTSDIKPQKDLEAAEERERILRKIAAAGQPKSDEGDLAIPAPEAEVTVIPSRPKRVQYIVKKDGNQDSLSEFWRKTEGRPTTDTETQSKEQEAGSRSPSTSSGSGSWGSLPWNRSSSGEKGNK